ncbi:MAG: threonine dehydratase [Gammaproteobacteria bacterium]|jgi:threonine dehydratase
MTSSSHFSPSLESIYGAAQILKSVVHKSPFHRNQNLSNRHHANVLLKREDLQVVRSYKIRGAYHKMSGLSSGSMDKGIVCASAGNHAQGVAFSCNQLKVNGVIFMPAPTPKQKIAQVNMFGGPYTKVVLIGDTFDDAYKEALAFSKEKDMAFIHPFDDEKVIEGQATVGLEMLEQATMPIDYLFLPVGGGGLAAGVSTVFKQLSPKTKVIGVEPEGAPSMSTSIKNGSNTTLLEIEKFVDGAAVKRVGDKTFAICRNTLDDMITVPSGKVCETILQLYNEDAIVVEPAGALTISALDQFHKEIKGKNVVCLVSGSNNDITRMEEIKERAMLFKELKHYFIVNFPQRAGALKEFVNEVLGPEDDITYFEYYKKQNREKGPAIVGIEIKNKADLGSLINRMKKRNFFGEYLNEKPDLLNILI